MDRRDVLKLGAVASLSGTTGCAALLGNPGQVSSNEMDGFLSELDGALTGISNGRFFDQFLEAKPSAEQAERIRKGEDLAKKTMRSLLLIGTMQELPPEQLAHEGVQKRLRESMGEFDDAMFGMSSILEGMSTTERADIAQALRDDPALGMRVMGAVDQEAANFGVSLKQRTRLRTLSTHVCGRLRQSPELTMTEYTGKMQKLGARYGALSEAQRTAAASLGASMIWQSEGQATGGSPELSAPPPPPVDEQRIDQSPPPQQQPQQQGVPYTPKKADKSHSHPSTGLLTAGGIALGLGLTVFGLGFVGQGGWLFLGVTFGVLLGLAGLICLIIGFVFLATGR
jgi:hypothetical protein